MLSRLVVIILLVGSSCSESPSYSSISSHPYAAYFYKYDSIPKVYVYRDVIDGLKEQFHRVYGIEDSEGKHIVIEHYASEGRLTQAFNFNLDSLDVIDHMVVNVLGENEKATVYKKNLFPYEKDVETKFASKFSGFMDSTVLLMELDILLKGISKRKVLKDSIDCIKMKEHSRLTLLNTSKKTENQNEVEIVRYFGKTLGLVEWHDIKKRRHFILEDIISQEKWIKLISQ